MLAKALTIAMALAVLVAVTVTIIMTGIGHGTTRHDAPQLKSVWRPTRHAARRTA